MYCIFAAENLAKFKGSRGKLASQAGHAYLHAFWDASSAYINSSYGTLCEWHTEREKYKQALDYQNSERAYKITLVVDTVEDLKRLQEKYAKRCGTALVTDAALTVFEEPTITCLGLGPISEVDDDISSLKVLT